MVLQALSMFSVWTIVVNIIGVVAGIIFGFLPGLSATMGVALLMPFTFNMAPVEGISLLLGVYCGGIYGGSITAILIRTPGTPASAATVLEGYPMTQQGRAKEALNGATLGSTLGGLFSCIILIFAAQAIAHFALRFGNAEYFAVAMFGLCMVTSLSSKNLIKGVIGVCLGYIASSIGMDQVNGLSRFSFGVRYMLSGIETVTALVGLFAISEIFLKIEKSTTDKGYGTVAAYDGKGMGLWELITKHPINLLRSSIIGTIVGIIPATGSGTAAWLSYNEAKRQDKTDTFGKGNVDGVIASETANNAVTGGALVPLLALGVPGDTVTAVLLGALTLQGLAPGPMLFVDHPAEVTAIYVLMVISNLFMCLFGMIGIKGFLQVLKVPPQALSAVVLGLCMTGAYAVRNYTFDIKCALLMGILGYIFTKADLPIPPILLGLLLGQTAEFRFRNFMTQNNAEWWRLFTFKDYPIASVLLLVAICAFLFPVVTWAIKKIKGGKQSKGEDLPQAE